MDADHPKPTIAADPARPTRLNVNHPQLAPHRLDFEPPDALLFTENESNVAACGASRAPARPRTPSTTTWSTDWPVRSAPRRWGTKAAVRHRRVLAPGEAWRSSCAGPAYAPDTTLGAAFDALFAQRIAEADAFYRRVTPFAMPEDLRNAQRQAFAGLSWSKQYYHDLSSTAGSRATPPTAATRIAHAGPRNHGWRHLDEPMCWRCPTNGSTRGSPRGIWPFTAWPSADRCRFRTQQLTLLTREWYMHPNGQIPAYECNFGDVNPPVHAWAAMRTCQIEQKMTGRMHDLFLAHVSKAADELYLVGEPQGRRRQHPV